MKTYVTFGQAHTHSINGRTFDKDCVALIEAPTQEEGRQKAWDLFSRKFCFTYFDQPPDMRYFHRGFLKV